MDEKKILLLGVGNLLYTDEGVGVHAARYFEENYFFSDNVTLMEGGTLGKLLMPSLLEADQVIVMDAVLGGESPGAVYRLTDEGLRKSMGFRDSQHQVDLVDTLICCELIGKRPNAVVIGMEPHDWQNLSMELSPPVRSAFPRFIELIRKELADCGGASYLKSV